MNEWLNEEMKLHNCWWMNERGSIGDGRKWCNEYLVKGFELNLATLKLTKIWSQISAEKTCKLKLLTEISFKRHSHIS